MLSGWRPRLPGYAGDFDPESQGASLLPALLMMAPFAPAREHAWFKRALEHLFQFSVDPQRVCFPASYVLEKRAGYWPWSRMQLEEGRRTARSRALESTFWLAKICKLGAGYAVDRT